jgi:hypothetical protein
MNPEFAHLKCGKLVGSMPLEFLMFSPALASIPKRVFCSGVIGARMTVLDPTLKKKGYRYSRPQLG